MMASEVDQYYSDAYQCLPLIDLEFRLRQEDSKFQEEWVYFVCSQGTDCLIHSKQEYLALLVEQRHHSLTLNQGRSHRLCQPGYSYCCYPNYCYCTRLANSRVCQDCYFFCQIYTDVNLQHLHVDYLNFVMRQLLIHASTTCCFVSAQAHP